jgi:ADP-ribose pyrophosphatase
MDHIEKLVRSQNVFTGKIFDVETQYVELENGKEVTRDVVLHPGATAIVPINDKHEIYMVRQFRKAVDQCLLEIPAGKLDFPGEDPLLCAIRELKEETGLEAGKIIYYSSILTSPGFSNEVIYLYFATELIQGDSNPDDDEFLSVEKYPIDELIKMIADGDIADAKTIIGILAAANMLRKQPL